MKDNYKDKKGKCIVCQVVINSIVKTKQGRAIGGVKRVQLKDKSAEKVSPKWWSVSKILKTVREFSLWIFGGRTFQRGEAASADDLRQGMSGGLGEYQGEGCGWSREG